jgi:hypothetical protein
MTEERAWYLFFATVMVCLLLRASYFMIIAAYMILY